MTTTQVLLDSLLANKASINLATTEQKNQALSAMADQLVAQTEAILAGNAIDMEHAQGKISQVMQDRLLLTEERIEAMADGIRALIGLPDPVGLVLEESTRADGLNICKKSIPFGLVGMIYESRPNVTSDAAALAIKSGNAVILRGGKEAFHSAKAIVTALKSGLEEAGVSPKVIELVQDTSRVSATELMTAKGKIDLLVPRGGAGLIQAVVENATVPVIETGTGICHVYVDKDADLDKALRIVVNAKTSRPSVCNAAEVLLVHEEIASQFLPRLEEALSGQVELRADSQAQALLNQARPAGDQDFDTEFLDYIMAVKVVSSVEEAISHIAQHSTGHSEAIVTENSQTAEHFTLHVDSAAVYVNASTRFTDGGEFGLGCELGISTQKMHARGPMGLREMTTYKYIITGDGHIR
ncbi:glutamate-5-semialdehyde dehydrogenase [Streptococcus suis]|uniref:Gamma-glutamyl phosphate reductase n=6 Tax=Streptococcus suis TaxID=1307 RepID=PROA_STRS2|nr:glutamate-5-semialdehyde dehydrogenase [Streptococcus suis]A4VTT5.1 RecName: Full=Gamma-glutamyl phosphate reductase; Short=GPR; AltName: Full=Glutamate-5-semialdehyde dehydrogenase; AltName: Full=Glutamyl-gamma-semialdehyde dehydrogenase; Short=GSA dehydrogenase [Streptococcus suis 05ZYH33]A4W028.1 RecName: Full=Gamma-glutamyl phosphate reductase; Short=GPR; AltName: Full=Glutamate-5-semialdehyde dehydrogenase; AltName: Full=Glutamyl-gamma-semialdehyde dehydrogenase; Short=GSA dehydrogenase [